MKFGPVATGKAAGVILAHSLALASGRLRKGHVLTPYDIVVLQEQGIETVIAAVLEAGDIGEDEAAGRIAAALAAPGLALRPAGTGRVNLFAEVPGVFRAGKPAIDAFNAVDEAITLATLPDYSAVTAGQMVATVKIIPLAVAGAQCDAAIAALGDESAVGLKPWQAMRTALIQTELPTIKPSVLDKTRRVTEARLAPSASTIVAEKRTAHTAEAVSAAIADLAPQSDLILVFGASAVSDAADVIPAAIRMAGGSVERVGMPVDPGNLLVLGELGGKPVVGAPGCARSPKPNGFDWVLQRILAGIDVTSADIAGLGVGGLLMEIETRPQPRDEAIKAPALAVAVLAAGRSTRMGARNKLLATFDGEPLIRRTVSEALKLAMPVTVVTGHEREVVEAALEGLEVQFAHNPDYADGLSTSLATAVAAAPETADGLVVMLGDMPQVTAAMVEMLAARFAAEGGRKVVRAVHGGKPGNPVILPRSVFAAAANLKGDVGARHLIEASGVGVVDVDLGEGASVDVDTPEALAAAGGRFSD
ncbi:MAG: NTP transferase domain-containing protein [Brucellaceae bacterium]|nr:NTP transferase domain-containing protein [Brucellaceae bacterium]